MKIVLAQGAATAIWGEQRIKTNQAKYIPFQRPPVPNRHNEENCCYYLCSVFDMFDMISIMVQIYYFC